MYKRNSHSYEEVDDNSNTMVYWGRRSGRSGLLELFR
jgi:hypothetical protein